MKRTLVLVTLHGETDRAHAAARLVDSHRIMHPGWRTPDELAALDQARLAAIAEAETNGAFAAAEALQQNPVPSGHYAEHFAHIPEPPEPACDVVAVFRDDTSNGAGDFGSRFEVHVADWDEASALRIGMTFEAVFK